MERRKKKETRGEKRKPGEKKRKPGEKKEREKKERRKKIRKEKKCTTPGFEPATFISTGTTYRLKVGRIACIIIISIADFHFDDLIVAALAHARSLCQ